MSARLTRLARQGIDTMAKPPIIMHATTALSLERLTQQNTASAENKDTSVAEMLSQLHGVAGMLLQELRACNEPVAKRLSMAKDMAKLIPLLALAERKVRKAWKDKDVEDMTDRELLQARKALKVVKGPR